MILSSLHLENFKKYTSYEIEFGEGLVGIIGKNGSGKSTLFEAILFALYGEAKNRGNKELIRNANASTKEPVVVELLFEFESIIYRVVREFRGKSLTANAKLFKNEVLITSGAKEVTKEIVRLTKMSKDAFMHTLFASQKELTSLSTLKNEDRKKMIRKLLGLEKIDFIENTLIEKNRQLKREIDAFKEVLLADEDIAQKQEQIQKHNEQKELLLQELKSKNKALQKSKKEQLQSKKSLEIFAKTKEQKQNLFAQLQLTQNSLDAQMSNQAKLTTQLAQLQEKEQEFKKLKPLREEFYALQEQLKTQEKQKEFYLKKEGILKEQNALKEEWRKSKADILALEDECKMHQSYITQAKNLEEKLRILEKRIEQINAVERELLAKIVGEQKQIEVTNKKIEKLQAMGSQSPCPTCTRPLLEEYDNVVNSLATIVETTYQKNVDTLTTELLHVRVQKSELDAEKKLQDKEFANIMGEIKIIESKLQDLQKAKEYFLHVEQRGIKNKEELKLLQKYSYDEKIHNQLKNSFGELEVKYNHLLALETELKRLDFVQSELADTDKKIAQLHLTCKDIESQYIAIVYDEKQHEQALVEDEKIAKDIEIKTANINEINVHIARIDGEINSIQSTLINNELQLKKLQTKKDNVKDFEKIKMSLAEFKTKLNAKVSPRISSIASEMYAQITKGKYQHIEVSNDFDFFIYDEGKRYPIERYSGGEIDLANLVLRIAISKTLTELSGASSIEFLAFDEVFGSQDENRRIEILEAFHTIKEQYRQIFLISHEMEIKEMFERVVEL